MLCYGAPGLLVSSLASLSLYLILFDEVYMQLHCVRLLLALCEGNK